MKAIMLMAYGSPSGPDDIEAYYTHIRGGRRPSAEQLADLRDRYRAIGGASPLPRITNRQVEGLQRELERCGSETRVYAAMKHSHPFISEVVEQQLADGVDSLLSIALTPHYSSMSTGSYIKAVEDANSKVGGKIRLEFVSSWHTHPGLIAAWQKRIAAARKTIGEGAWLVFTAHSLPERIITEGDPYRDQLLETSRATAERLRTNRWSFSFQSASRTSEPWLQPDIMEHLTSLNSRGETKFIIAPIGFVSDHLEILYDIDVECKSWARERNADFVRCESLNDSEDLIQILVSLARSRGFL